MKYKLSILLIFIGLITIKLKAQELDLNEWNKEKEAILNVVVNSIQFDSVYNFKQIYFVDNELLSKEMFLIIKKGKCKIKIKQREELKKRKIDYVTLGDFTMNKINPTHVRIQITAMPQEILLNLSLEKQDDIWVIANHLIMKD